MKILSAVEGNFAGTLFHSIFDFLLQSFDFVFLSLLCKWEGSCF